MTQLIASAGRMKMTNTSPIARNIARGNSLAGFRSDDTCTAFISMPEYDRKLLTISTRLASPAQAGSRWLADIGAAEGCPCPRNTMPSTTSSAPGTSVPMMRPPLARPATPFVPREEIHTPDQYAITMTDAVQSPLPARLGSKT